MIVDMSLFLLHPSLPLSYHILFLFTSLSPLPSPSLLTLFLSLSFVSRAISLYLSLSPSLPRLSLLLPLSHLPLHELSPVLLDL